MIETERLKLRPVEVADWRDIQAIWIDQKKSEYAQYDNFKETDDKSVEARIQKWVDNQGNDHIFYSVCLGEKIIGFVNFNVVSDGYEMSYTFHSDYQGNGYAIESILALLEYMHQIGNDHIVVGTALNNTPSVKLLKRLGFTLSDTERVSFYKDDNGEDIVFEGGIFKKELS